jgi:hypothetical protein
MEFFIDMEIPDDETISDVINDMDYDFNPNTDNARVTYMEMVDFTTKKC